MSRLPDKASDLIDLCVSDLEKAERDPLYCVNMNVWHNMCRVDSPISGVQFGQCAVCAAGAIMAFSLGGSINKQLFPDCFNRDISRRLEAIDLFRLGYWRSGLKEMNVDLSGLSVEENERICQMRCPGSYRRSPEEFKSRMRKASKVLREMGL